MRKFVSYLIITVFFVQNVLANVIVDTFDGWRMELGNQVVGHSPGQLGEAYKKIFDALRTGKAGPFDGFIDRYASDSEETAIIKAAMLRGIFDFQSDDLGGKNVIKHTDVVDDDHRLDWITKAETIALGFKYYDYQSEDSKQHMDKVKLHNYIVDAYLLAGRELWRHFGGWYNDDNTFRATLAAKNDFLDNFINQFSDKLKGYGIESPEEFVDFKNLKKYFYQIIKENKGLLLLFTNRYEYDGHKQNAKKKLGVSQVKVYGNKRNFVNDRQAKDAFILGLYDENFQRTKQNDQAVNAAYGKGQLTDATNIIDIVNDIYAAAQVRQSYNDFEKYKNSKSQYEQKKYSDHRKVVRNITNIPESVRGELLSKLKGAEAFSTLASFSSALIVLDRVNTLIGSGNEESKVSNARALIEALSATKHEKVVETLVYNHKHSQEALSNYLDLLSLIKGYEYQAIREKVVTNFNRPSQPFEYSKDQMLELAKLARGKIGKKSKLLVLYNIFPAFINLAGSGIDKIATEAVTYKPEDAVKLEKLAKKLTLKSMTEYQGGVISKLVALAEEIPEEVLNSLEEKEYSYDQNLVKIINQIKGSIGVYSIPKQIFLARVAQFNPTSPEYFVGEVKKYIASMDDKEVLALIETMSNLEKSSDLEYIELMAKLHKSVDNKVVYATLKDLHSNIDSLSTYKLRHLATAVERHTMEKLANLELFCEKIGHDPSSVSLKGFIDIIYLAQELEREVIVDLAEPGIDLGMLKRVNYTPEAVRPALIVAMKRPALRGYVVNIQKLLVEATSYERNLFVKVVNDSKENASYKEIINEFERIKADSVFRAVMQDFSDEEKKQISQSGLYDTFAKLKDNFSSDEFAKFKKLLLQAKKAYGNLKAPLSIITSLRPRKDDPDMVIKVAKYVANDLSEFKDNVEDITNLIWRIGQSGSSNIKFNDSRSLNMLKRSLGKYVKSSAVRQKNIVKALSASTSITNNLIDLNILTFGDDDIGARVLKIFGYLHKSQQRISGESISTSNEMSEMSQEQYEAAVKLLDDENFRKLFFWFYDANKDNISTDYISDEVLNWLMDKKWSVKSHEALAVFLDNYEIDYSYGSGRYDEYLRDLSSLLKRSMIAATAIKDLEDDKIVNLYEPYAEIVKNRKSKEIDILHLPEAGSGWTWKLHLWDSMYLGSNTDRKLIVDMLKKHFKFNKHLPLLNNIIKGFAVMLKKGTDSEEISKTVAIIDKLLDENDKPLMRKNRSFIANEMKAQNFNKKDDFLKQLKNTALKQTPYQLFTLLEKIPAKIIKDNTNMDDLKKLLDHEGVTFEKKQEIIQKLGSKYDSWKVYEFAFNNEYKKMSAEIEENKQRRKRILMDKKGFESKQKIVKKLEVQSYSDYEKHYINLTGLQTLDDELPADADAAEVAINKFMKYFREQAVRDYVRKENFQGADVSSGDIKDAFEEDVKEVLADLKLYVVKPGADIPERFVEKDGEKEPRKIETELMKKFFNKYFNPYQMSRGLVQKVMAPKDFANLALWQDNANLASQSGNKNEAMKYQTMIAKLTKNKNIRPEILLQFMAKDKSAIAEKIKQLESEIADLEKKKSTVDPNNLKLLNKQRELRQAKGDAKKQADIQKEIDEITGDNKIKEKQKLLEELKDPKSTYASRVLIESNNLGEYFKVDEETGWVNLIYKGPQAILEKMGYLAK